jgi:hypothetical protein
MGFLKDLTTLTRQGAQAQQRMDVGAHLAAASQAMQQAGTILAAAAPAPRDPAAEALRVPVAATVVDARQLPLTIGLDLVVEVDVHVLMPGGVPVPVTCTVQLSPLTVGRVQPGATVQGSIVPGRPDTLRIDGGA